MTSLKFLECDLCPASVATLANLLDAFPMIANLDLRLNRGIGDDGVAVLAQGLLAASRTRLTSLYLAEIGMGDKGLAALADVIRAGHFEELDEIYIYNNPVVTDEGVCAFARAIMGAGQRGLPMLSLCSASGLTLVTGEGVGTLAHVLVDHCPRLKKVDLSGCAAVGAQATVNGMVRAAVRGHRLAIYL